MTMTRFALLLLAAGCAADDGRRLATSAVLSEGGDAGPAARAWYTTVGGISYEAFRPMAAGDRLHHLDIMDHSTGDAPALALGVTYVGGPAVDGRGSLDGWVGPDGVLVGDYPVPWIDLVSCDGDVQAGPATCRTADRVEVTLDDAGAGRIRVTYEAAYADGSVAGGSFVAEPDVLHGDPG
jgi:hypothetical protein